MAMATALSGELLAAVQGLEELLAHDLALDEEGRCAAGARYEVWSPYDAAGAADALTQLLAEDARTREAPGAVPTA
jgi:hypothetical protein